jgi:hypothetical protein
MDNQGVPEAWIGQEVVVHTVSSREFLATLVEVKDFGFVYRFRDSEDIIFAPWSVLRTTGSSPYSRNTPTRIASEHLYTRRAMQLCETGSTARSARRMGRMTKEAKGR